VSRTTALLTVLAAALLAALLPSVASADPAPPCPTPDFAPLVAGEEGFVPVAQHCPPDEEDRDPERWEIGLDFGDGTSGTATFAADHWFAGGLHTYAQPGTYRVVATVTYKPTGTVKTYEADVTVAAPPPPPPAAASPAPGTATAHSAPSSPAPPCPAVTLAPPPAEGTEGIVAVAQHCPRLAADRDVTRFQVRMDFGDGTSGSGRMLDAWVFLIGGEHTYRRAGDYTVRATVRNLATGEEWTYVRPVRIRNAPLTAVRLAAPRFTVARTSAPQPLVAFRDGNPLARKTSHRATISWGDGTRSRGTIRKDEDGRFVVLGRHRYTKERPRTIRVTVLDGRQKLVLRTRALVGRVLDELPERR